MKLKIITSMLVAIFLASCASSGTSSLPVSTESMTSPASLEKTRALIVPVATATEHLLAPTELTYAAPAITTTPWVVLPHDGLKTNSWILRCQISGVSFEVVEILPNIDATGFLICGGFKIPAGLHDRNTNTLYYWSLYPIVDPKILDHLGERGIERFLTTYGFGSIYSDYENLIGVNIAVALNLLNEETRILLNAYYFGSFTNDYWGSQEAIDIFGNSGVLPKDNNILLPIDIMYNPDL